MQNIKRSSWILSNRIIDDGVWIGDPIDALKGKLILLDEKDGRNDYEVISGMPWRITVGPSNLIYKISFRKIFPTIYGLPAEIWDLEYSKFCKLASKVLVQNLIPTRNDVRMEVIFRDQFVAVVIFTGIPRE